MAFSCENVNLAGKKKDDLLRISDKMGHSMKPRTQDTFQPINVS